MKKSYAIRMLGGTPTKAAQAIGITPSAVGQWPEDPTELPNSIRDRVQAALWRKRMASLRAGRMSDEIELEGSE